MARSISAFLLFGFGVALASGLMTLEMSFLKRFVFERELLYVIDQGTVIVDEPRLREEVEKLLPQHRSNFFWYFGTHEIANGLLRYPGLKNSEVETCAWYSFRCYEIRLEFRPPAFLAEMDQRWWLLAADGQFIRPHDLSRDYGQTYPKITGLYRMGQSPERVRSVVAGLSKASQEIENSSTFSISSIKLRRTGGAVIAFDQVPYSFEFPPILGAGKDELTQLGQRVRSIVELKKGSAISIKSVDLRFSDLGVVKRAQVKVDEFEKVTKE